MSTSEARAARVILLDVIRSVRWRWRGKVLLRGLLVTGVAALLFLVLAAYGLERFNFAPGAVITFRIIAALVVLGVVGRFVVWPLRRRVTDEQVALYLEEHEPSLESTLISALESDSDVSPAFETRTIELAIERCHRIDDGRQIDRRELRRFAAAVAGVSVIGIILTGFGPPFLRHGASALLNPFGTTDASPYRINVEPGNATIARGSDQVVTARLIGWADRPGAAGTAQQIDIVLRAAGDSVFQRIPLVATDSAYTYEVLLFDVANATDYYIDADGVRSPLFRIEVADLPYVENIQLIYDYPDYTGLPDETIDDGGDIIALRGTRVTVRALTTMPVAGARVLLDNGQAVRMQPGVEGRMQGDVRVAAGGFYTIELTTSDNVTLTGSPQYLIDVIDDRGPGVRLSRPGHDVRPTTVEEVFVEASATDDFGVQSLEIVYNVNGGEERTIPLMNATRGQPLTEVSAGHTFYLEELNLRPGDLVSYYARATDNSGAATAATSDIFFMNIRPFGRDYRQAESAGGGGGGGQRGESPGELSQQQREIITATFNLVRDSATYTDRAFAENVNTIALMQDRLREQVTTLHERMGNRQITNDSMFARIAEILPQAVTEMASALVELRRPQARDALGPEQRALQHLQAAEALYREVQVAFEQQQGGGGGGGGSPNAEDLADLFELERDQLRNQYETVQRGEQQQSQNQAEVDAALERLRQLARRQEQENERLRQQAAMRQNQQGGGGSAQSQRQLADETEEAARQLERLSREMRQPELADVARQMQQAADEMRRSAANTRSGNTANANAALNQLEQARRRLEQSRRNTIEQQSREALDRANRLAQEQRAVSERMQRLERMTGSERAAEGRSIIEQKEDQLEELATLQQQLDQLAVSSRSEQRDASRRIQEAANSIRDNQLQRVIEQSRAFAYSYGNDARSREFEQRITQGIDEVRERLEEANRAIASGPGRDTQDALERMQRLARSMESMQQRARDSQGESGQQGQRGEQQGDAQQRGEGEQGGQQQGQQSQQSQQSQQGQQSQQSQQGGQPGGQQGGQRGGEQGQQMGGGPAGGPGARGAIGPRGGPISADDVRQFRAEMRARLEEAQALRQQLARDGQDVTALSDVIRDMRLLSGADVWSNTENLERLQAAVVDGLKQYEFGLRRAVLGTDRDQLFLSGTDEVPEGFRKLVEEYYRALARERR